MKYGIIEFIEYCKKRKKDDATQYTSFTVNVETGYKEQWYLPVFGQRHDRVTISLDKEDLEYLYNKYISQYKEAVKERNEQNKIRKQEEIKELEKQLNKLKNENS